MAMVKSALTILAEEEIAPAEILARLHRLLRNRPGERGFVTLTLAELSPATGELTLTNAGHPPCYLVRASGGVEEIALPSSPLGGLPGPPATGGARLGAGDGVVWLSDGIAECASPAGDPFGYERVAPALAGPFASAAELRDRLMESVRRHCAELPCEDDRTLVVLRYTPPAASDAASPRAA
jgi:sigma-B regulation protein RsbU (phosphoserine phosphatase)